MLGKTAGSSGGGRKGTRALGRPHTPDEVPVVPVAVVIAAELALTVAQVVTTRGIVRCSGPPDPAPSTVRAIVVVALGDSGESS